MTMLVTGATGFVGTALIARLLKDGCRDVRIAVRRGTTAAPPGVDPVVIADISADTDWRHGLENVDTVVHLAGRVHVMKETALNPLEEFRRVNVEGTRHLATQAAAAGVRRLIFVSSIKVNGESGTFTERDMPAPADAYGLSKHEAEIALRATAAATGMEVVIIRPPLVYGPGVRANFAALVRAVVRGVPLPLGAVHNRRSLVAVDNLVDFILTCASHPAAANNTFLVSDGEDLSTTDLVRRIAQAAGRRPRLVPVPTSVLFATAVALGRRELAIRLLGSLQVDIAKARQLGWVPPVSVDEALRRSVAVL